MTDKKTYRIDENALREKFANYTVSFNAESINCLETEIAQVKPHNPIELPDTKKLVQFIGIPVAIGLLGCVAYFGFNYIKNLPPSTPKQDTVTVTKPVVEPKIEEKKEVATPPVNTNTTVVNAEVKPKEVIATPIVAQPIKAKEKKTTPVQPIPVKKDSGQASVVEKAKIDTAVERKNKPDTTGVSRSKDVQSKKKKKKRKNSLDATEDIRESQPNSADDDVVIPDSPK